MKKVEIYATKTQWDVLKLHWAGKKKEKIAKLLDLPVPEVAETIGLSQNNVEILPPTVFNNRMEIK